MEHNSGASTTYMGHTLGEISDLAGIDAYVIEAKWASPRLFTLGEAAALAPHLNMTTSAFLAWALGEVLA